MYNNLVIFYTSIFQFIIIPFAIYANYKQLVLIKKNKSNGSFSKMFCIFFIYSCFFNILYYFKHKYDLVFFIRDVFFLIFQTLILLYYFENKKNEDLDFLRKEFYKEEKIKNNKVNEKHNISKKLLGNENKKDNFDEIKKNEIKFVEKLVKIEKIIIDNLKIKIPVSNYSKNEELKINTKQKSNSKIEEKIQKIKINLKNYFFLVQLEFFF